MSESINTRLISGAIQSYMELGVNEDDQFEEGPMLTVYKEAFESQFLAETERYYTRKSTGVAAEPSYRIYERGRGFSAGGARRAQAYLHQSTRGKLVRKCRQVLVEKHLEIFSQRFQNLLNANKCEDLRCMYKLIYRIRMAWENLKNSWRHTFLIRVF